MAVSTLYSGPFTADPLIQLGRKYSRGYAWDKFASSWLWVSRRTVRRNTTLNYCGFDFRASVETGARKDPANLCAHNCRMIYDGIQLGILSPNPHRLATDVF